MIQYFTIRFKCYSYINIHVHILLWNKIKWDFKYLAYKVIFNPRCHGNAIQDDISTKTVSFWLHDSILSLGTWARTGSATGTRKRFIYFTRQHPFLLYTSPDNIPSSSILHQTTSLPPLYFTRKPPFLLLLCSFSPPPPNPFVQPKWAVYGEIFWFV